MPLVEDIVARHDTLARWRRDIHWRMAPPPRWTSVRRTNPSSTIRWRLAAEVCDELVGSGNVRRRLPAGTGSEDFSYMLNEVPGCYVLAWKYASGDGVNAGTSLRVSGRGTSPG